MLHWWRSSCATSKSSKSPALAAHPIQSRRHEPFPGPAGIDAQHAGVEVKAALLERDRLRGADSACGQQFEQRAVAKRGGGRSARLREQLVDRLAAEGLWAALGEPWACQRARRVALDHRAEVQMTVERAHAGRLAMQRRARERCRARAAAA